MPVERLVKFSHMNNCTSPMRIASMQTSPQCVFSACVTRRWREGVILHPWRLVLGLFCVVCTALVAAGVICSKCLMMRLELINTTELLKMCLFQGCFSRSHVFERFGRKLMFGPHVWSCMPGPGGRYGSLVFCTNRLCTLGFKVFRRSFCGL